MTLLLSIILQFPDIVQFCEDMANLGKTVIVAALDGTYQRKVGGVMCKVGGEWLPPCGLMGCSVSAALWSNPGAGAPCRDCD